MKRYCTVLIWLLGAYLFSQGIYMDAKAKLAQVLITHSWEQSLANKSPPPKPWWWADTHVIAKMEVPRLSKTLFVMRDSSGESLAFGPGHLIGSAPPASTGHSMIAGHRDSHFEFLQTVQLNDIITVMNHQGQTKHYRVTNRKVVDTEKEPLMLFEQEQLTLITCYPFDQLIPNGTLRYLVNAELAE